MSNEKWENIIKAYEVLKKDTDYIDRLEDYCLQYQQAISSGKEIPKLPNNSK